MLLFVLLIGWFPSVVSGEENRIDHAPGQIQSLISGTEIVSTVPDSLNSPHIGRRIRNTVVGVILVFGGFWMLCWFWRRVAFRNLYRKLSDVFAYLRAIGQRLSQRPHTSCVIGALVCTAVAAILVRYAWAETISRGVQSIYLWQIFFAASGLFSATAFFAFYVIWHRRYLAFTGTLRNKNYHLRRAHVPYVLSMGCVLMLGTFRWLDIWNSGFDEQSWHYLIYNMLRLAFMAYLVMALVGTGSCVLSLIKKRCGPYEFSSGEHALAAFFAGAATWYIASFLLGQLGAIRPLIVAPIFVSAVWFSWQPLHTAFCDVRNHVQRELSNVSVTRLFLVAVPTGMLIPLWLHVLVTQGLAINGFGYDSSGHYLPYYQAVVTSGSTEINELWYHFWVTKGAGLHFIATILTDIQGPQLTSFAFLTTALVTLALLVHRVSASLALGIAAAVIFLAPFAYTFAYYQKLHIVTTALIGGLLWLTTQAWLKGQTGRSSIVVLVSLLSFAIVLHTPPLSAVVCSFLLATLLIERALRLNKYVGRLCITATPAAIVLLGIMLVLIFNYLKTGLMEVTPFRLFWSLADQSVFSFSVSPYLMLFADEGTSSATGKAALTNAFDSLRLAHLLHIQFLPNLLVFTSLIVLVGCLLGSFFDRKLRDLMVRAIVPAATLVATAAILACLVSQPGSIDRFYVFVLFPLVCLTVSLPGIVMHRLVDTQLGGAFARGKTVVLVLFSSVVVGIAGHASATWTQAYFHNTTLASFYSKLRFVLGGSSFRETLLEKWQPRDPGAWPKGEISEACLGIRSALASSSGTGQTVDGWPKVWTMTFLQESGCHILPGVRIMMEFSNRFGEKWHRIVLGAAKNAEIELDRIGISHVFVDLGERDNERKTGESTSIFGCLAYSPLLDPATLESKFRMVWSNGDAYLLVLASKGSGSLLPQGFAERFEAKRVAVQPGLGNMQAICQRLANYYRTFGEKWPVNTDTSLPKLQGWQ